MYNLAYMNNLALSGNGCRHMKRRLLRRTISKRDRDLSAWSHICDKPNGSLKRRTFACPSGPPGYPFFSRHYCEELRRTKITTGNYREIGVQRESDGYRFDFHSSPSVVPTQSKKQLGNTGTTLDCNQATGDFKLNTSRPC